MGLRSLLSELPFIPSDVTYLRQEKPENCVQTVVAMALNVPVELIEEEAGTTGRLTVGETFSLLGRIGVSVRSLSADLAADFWPNFYRRYGGRDLRGMGFELPQGEGEKDVGHAYFLTGNQMYDPATGKKEKLEPEAIEKLDWLALFPPELARASKLESLRRALRGNGSA